jgi:Predicted endonuclease distantly related to archaeal Holliday junction resolvase
VEVKTRKSSAFGEPEEFVTLQKQRNLIRAAASYITKFGITKEVRFDIVSVILNEQQPAEVKHIPDAFKPRW